MKNKAGELFIVATPIGNLKDMSFRAVEVLQGVDRILVEDTRNAVKLLQHYGIRQPLKAFHEHNEKQLSQEMVRQLEQGQHIALISDAGTPLMSDPGYRLVKAAQEAGIQAQAVPGPCAAIAALSVSGLATDRFAFEGFLPSRSAAREQRLRELDREPRTLVFYEARHRIIAFLGSLQAVLGGQRKIAVARELTKKFETVYAGSVTDVITQMQGDEQAQKGEFVVMVEGADPRVDEGDLDRILEPLLHELGIARASKLAARITGLGKNRCYQRALELQEAAN